MRISIIIIFSALVLAPLFALDETPMSANSRLERDDYGDIYAIVELNLTKVSAEGTKTIAFQWPADRYDFADYTGFGEIHVADDNLAIYFRGEGDLHILRFRARHSETTQAKFSASLIFSAPETTPGKPEIEIFKEKIELHGTPPLDGGTVVPKEFSLACSPNPFNSAVSINYSLVQEGAIDLAVYDILGREVATLDRGSKSAGMHTAIWHGDNSMGTQVSSGIYFVKLVTNDETKIARIQFVK